jgi:hypothetical protein
LIGLFAVVMLLGHKSRLIPQRFYQLTLAIGTLMLPIIIFECIASHLGRQLRFALVDARRDRGMFRLDPQWELSPRYSRRLRANSDTVSQWEYDDLVQTAIIPAEVAQPLQPMPRPSAASPDQPPPAMLFCSQLDARNLCDLRTLEKWQEESKWFVFVEPAFRRFYILLATCL